MITLQKIVDQNLLGGGNVISVALRECQLIDAGHIAAYLRRMMYRHFGNQLERPD